MGLYGGQEEPGWAGAEMKLLIFFWFYFTDKEMRDLDRIVARTGGTRRRVIRALIRKEARRLDLNDSMEQFYRAVNKKLFEKDKE